MERKQRAVRPFYLMVQGNEYDLSDVVKAVKKKLAERTIAKEELKQLETLKKAFDSYRKAKSNK